MITKEDLLYWSLVHGKVFKVIRWGTIKLHTPNKGIEIHVARLPGKYQAKWYPSPAAEKKTNYTTDNLDYLVEKINQAVSDHNANWVRLPEDQWRIDLPNPRIYNNDGNVLLSAFFNG